MLLLLLGLVFLKVFALEARNLEESLSGDRIVGGIQVLNSSNVYQVSLSLKGEFLCGGSIIGDQWIISAARCVLPNQTEVYHIEYGSLERHRGKLVKISEVIPYPRYQSIRNNIKNDIALIKTAEKLDLKSGLAAPIELYNNTIGDNAVGAIFGWGYRHVFSKHPAEHLQMAIVKRVPCPTHLHESYMCLRGKQSAPCEKDWGGPFVIDGKLAGIASRPAETRGDKKKCQKGSSSAYTNIGEFKSWIEETIRGPDQNNN